MKRLGTALMLALLVSSCALLLGERYRPLDSIPQGMGVIYIYDKGAGVGERVFISPEANAPSAKHYLLLATDGYYPYLVSAGEVRIFADQEGNPFGCVTLEVAPRSSYWVSVSEKGDALVVSYEEPEAARRELGAHRRLKRSALSKAAGVASPEPCASPFQDQPEPAVDEPPEPTPEKPPEAEKTEEDTSKDEDVEDEESEEDEDEVDDSPGSEIELL